MPNGRSRLILKGSRVKPAGISPSANQRQSEFGFQGALFTQITLSNFSSLSVLLLVIC